MDRPRSSGQPGNILPSIPEFNFNHPPSTAPGLRGTWHSEDAPSRPSSQGSYEIFEAAKPARESKMAPTVGGGATTTITTEKEKETPSKLLVFSLFLSVFLSALDITIVTTALPTIAEHMHTNSTGFAWIGSAYLLAGAASGPIWAKTSDIFGRKPILMLANATFLTGSTMCALSKSMTTLITGRVIQGLGSGGLLVLVNVLIGDLWSPRDRGVYYGLLGLVWSVANASGPFLGGLFATKASWTWCFWVNVPLDGIALILTTFFLKVNNPATPFWEGIKAIDWLGCISVLGATVLMLLGIEFGGIRFPWISGPVITMILGGLAMWIIFFVIESRVAKYPLVPIRLLKNFSNICILTIDFSHSFVFIAGSYFLPVYFQAVLGANALLSGVLLLPFALSLSITSVATGYIITKTGAYRPLITGGMLFLTLGFALLIDLPEYASWGRIIIYQVIAGIGVGPNFQSPMVALQNSVAPHDIGAACSTFGFVRQFANAVSVVLGGVFLQSQLKGYEKEMLDGGIEARVVELFTGGSAVSSVNEINRLPRFARQVARKAFAQSLSKMWIMYACIGIIGLGLTDFIRKYELSKEHKETVTGLEEQERIRKHEAELRNARKKKKGNGVLPDIEGQPQNPEQMHSTSGRSAEVPGISIPERAPSRLSIRTPIAGGTSRASSSRSNLPGMSSDQMSEPRKEGAINAARKRANLRQVSDSIASGQHPVTPIQTDTRPVSRDSPTRADNEGYHPDDYLNEYMKDTSSDDDSHSIAIGLEYARAAEYVRATESTTSRLRSPLHRLSVSPRFSGSRKKGQGWGPLL